jgi:undecaprenyl-diphosphatase
MGFDLAFSQWLIQFYFLEELAAIFSGRIFSATLIAAVGIYFYRIKQLKIFFFICLVTGLGDLLGNFLKDIFLQPRPCYNLIEYFPEIDQCGPDLTGMPSNHALNFFIFSTLVHLFLRNPIISVLFFTSSVLVAMSRVLLLKHLLSQVIIGALIGVIMAILFFKAYNKWKET